MSETQKEFTILGTFSDGEIGVRPLLACGHYGRTICEQSSDWDFPMELRDCDSCRTGRYLDIDLQAHLMSSDIE